MRIPTGQAIAGKPNRCEDKRQGVATRSRLDKRRVCKIRLLVARPIYFLLFFPPLVIARLSAVLATLADLFLQAANRSPGLKGLTLMAALLLSAARPISQFACLYMPPGLKCSLISCLSPFLPLVIVTPLKS